MMYPLVLDLAADKIPVAVTCRVLGFSKQAFYKWRAKPISDRDYDDAQPINAAVDIHHDDPEFGYRFITDELTNAGWTASRNQVNRLCTSQQLWSVHARRRGRHRRPGPPVHDDLVRREFTAAQPDRLWLTDITEHPTAEGKLYLCAVKDACSKRIVGYSTDARMTSELAVRALRNAIMLRDPAKTAIVHSDRGSQFRSHAYQRVLRDAQLRGSMGQVGTCADNAAMESLQPAAEERAQPPPLAHPRRAPPRDRVLDRDHLPPAPTPRHTRPSHTYRIRDTGPGRSRGLTHPPQSGQRKSGQSHRHTHTIDPDQPGRLHGRYPPEDGAGTHSRSASHTNKRPAPRPNRKRLIP
jgi:transposase InsO family protein